METAEPNSERLDQAVTRLANVSRSASVRLIKNHQVKVDGIVKDKPSLKLSPNAQVSVDLPDKVVLPQIKLPIIYEDDHVIVINKPIGVLTHSKGEYNPEPTVATWLTSRVPSMEGNRAGIVHRLDRATSGVMILAKDPETLKYLQKQFSQRRTHKAYEAVVKGQLTPAEAVIDMPLMRNPKQPQTFRVGPNGKSALTHYRTIKNNTDYSLVELKPTTGRTHQLRVHLKALGHPIVGDVLYDGAPADRLYLHAKSLEITLPGGQREVFMAPVPASFRSMVK